MVPVQSFSIAIVWLDFKFCCEFLSRFRKFLQKRILNVEKKF